MPIEYNIDHERRLVTARGIGTLTHEDVFGYQLDVWSRAEVAGYDELVDMSGVGKIDLPSIDQVPKLAKLSASMDPRSPASKLAIVARDDFAFALARMYETYRGLDTASTKEVRVFRSLADALAFLRPEPVPPTSP
jgi:hypothetical protein